MKVLYIYIHVSSSSILIYGIEADMSLRVGPRGIAQYDLVRDELLVLNSRAIFCWILLFSGIEENSLKAHSRIDTKIANQYP